MNSGVRGVAALQTKVANKAMGERDVAIHGASKGETPRLRILLLPMRVATYCRLPRSAVDGFLYRRTLCSSMVRLWEPMVEVKYLEMTKRKVNVAAPLPRRAANT